MLAAQILCHILAQHVVGGARRHSAVHVVLEQEMHSYNMQELATPFA